MTTSEQRILDKLDTVLTQQAAHSVHIASYGTRLDKMDARLSGLEKWRYTVGGACVLLGALAQYVPGWFSR